MISMLMNHVWQSTLFAVAMGLMTLMLRKDSAYIRYWLWQAASLKFLVPFSILVAAGGHFSWQTAPIVTPPPLAVSMEAFAQPFPATTVTATTFVPAPAAPGVDLVPIIMALWACGFLAVLARWFVRWRRIAAALRAATPLSLTAAIPVKSTPFRLEPGVVGIVRPVLLVPEGIAAQLTPAELDAIVIHELCHVRRHDNLTAVLHMLVQALFWFHPLVWWLGTRLMEERERACDEAVVKSGSAPETYAEAILKVCKFYVQSPLACAAGVSGADLKQRIEAIMTNRTTASLNLAKKLLLATVSLIAIAGPLAVGWVTTPQAHAQATSPDAQSQSADVVAQRRAEQEKPRTEIKIDPKLLDKFVGYYLMPNGVPPVAITRQGDQLYAQITGRPVWPIYPESNEKFFYKVIPTQISFVADAQGQISELVLHQNGYELHAKRTDEATAKAISGSTAERLADQQKPRSEIKIDPKLLDNFVGDYALAGGALVVITRQGDQLFAQLSGQPSIAVYPESNNKFFYKVVAAQLSFTTDAQGHASELVIHQNGLELPAHRIDKAAANALSAPIDNKLAEQEKPRTAIAIDPKLLNKYVGNYSFPGGIPFAVTRQGDQLFAQLGGQPSLPIYPESNDKFFYKVVPAQVSFAIGADGHASGLVLHQNGAEQVAQRVDETAAKTLAAPFAQRLAEQQKARTAIQVDPKLLGKFVGSYSFPGDRHFVITLQGDQLYAQLTGQPSVPIYPESNDKFFYKVVAAQVSFDTNVEGQVTGLVLHQSGQEIPARREN